jgi:endoglucanase
MKTLCAEKLDCNVNAIGTVMEEVGTRGARAIPAEMVGDIAIILEGAPADDTPGQSALCRQGVVGKGVQVRLFDPTHITPPALADFVLHTAAEAGIPHQAAVRRTGGTDAAACYAHWQGTPTIVLSTPTRYIHSHNGIIDDRDLCACCDLVCAIVRQVAARQLKAIDFVS